MEQETAAKTATAKRFSEFALAPDVLEALEEIGITTVTPIQEKVIDPILEGKDVVGKAETGTGKTIGFGAPLVGQIDTQRVAVQGLILTPTRELAQQVAGVISQLGARRGLGVALIVGGVHASEQIETLRKGSQVVVGTPGRVLDFLRERILSLVWCQTVVLDEADRMLDMGFIDEVGAILDKIPEERQTLLFSATIPPAIQTLLKRYMKDPETFSTASGLATVPDIAQSYIEVDFPRKFRELQRILDANPGDTAILFCNTRRQAIDLDRMLWGHGYSAGALHGDQEQDVRFRILEAFRQGEIRTLVATDVASRGLDVESVTRVINYEVPDEPEAYVHRIGRTGRASKTGIAITLVSGKEWRQWQQILRDTGFQIERVGAPRRSHGGGRAERGERGRAERGRERGGRRGGRGRRGRGGESGGEAGRGRAQGPNGRSSRPQRAAQAAQAAHPEADEASGVTPGAAVALDLPVDERDRGREGLEGRQDASSGEPRRRRGRSRGGRGRRRQGRAREEGQRADGAEAPGQDAAGDCQEHELETAESAAAARESHRAAAKKVRERPVKVKLDALGDDFVKQDYFDIDSDLLQRAKAAEPTPQPGARSRQGRGQQRSESGRGAEGAAPGAPGESRGEAGSSGGRRRRRRRR